MEPKKYIRTFAADMETLKKGGAPDLAPLKEAKSSIEEHPIVAAPVVEESTLAPTPIPSSNEGHVSDAPLSIPILRAEVPTVPIPEPPPPPEPELAPIPEPPFEPEVPLPPVEPLPLPKEVEDAPALQTYEGDFYDHMKDAHASPATVLAAEQDAQSGAPQIDKVSSRDLMYTVAGVLLLIVGGVGMYAAYTSRPNTAPSGVTLLSVDTPILVEEQEQVSGAGVALLQAIKKSASRTLAPNTVRSLYLEKATTTDSIFSALQFPAPKVFLRNLNAADSMTGIINIQNVQSPFFILPVASYSETFSGLLSWERAMPHDLETLFPAYPVITGSSISATSSSPILPVGFFRDEVIANRDVRVYRDGQKRSVLLYGYWDQKMLIIARDPSAFAEIVRRLASAIIQK